MKKYEKRANEFIARYPDNTSNADIIHYVLSGYDNKNKYEIACIVLNTLRYLGEI